MRAGAADGTGWFRHQPGRLVPVQSGGPPYFEEVKPKIPLGNQHADEECAMPRGWKAPR